MSKRALRIGSAAPSAGTAGTAKAAKTARTAGTVGALALLALLAPMPAMPEVPALPALADVAPAAVSAPGISGDYLEARTADVYTGPCFANSEMDLVGKQAVMAWHVRQGAWQGVPLGGLSVVAAVRSSATLGDPFGGPLRASALIVVDQRATPQQRDALVAFAHAMSGELLSSVVAVESAPIEMAVSATAGSPGDPGEPGEADAGSGLGLSPEAVAARALHPAEHPGHHHLGAGLAVAGISGEAHLKAGAWIDLATRGIGPKDHLCGNEEVFYPPLTAGRSRVTAVPAVTVAYDFRGPGLGMVWSSPGKRSAFVGRFAH
jgi:hypothetical protein